MVLDDKYEPLTPDKLPKPEINSFAFSFCTIEEQAFIRGCESLINGREDRALRHFASASHHDNAFHDAWFMQAFLSLVQGNPDSARQHLLKILSANEPFHGQYILRFLPRLRMQVNLFEDFVFHVMPTTADAAAITARIYLLENKVHEAKKIIHAAFRQHQNNPVVRVVWAEVMIEDNAPSAVIEEIDRNIQFHSGDSETDLLLTFLIGRACFLTGDYRGGIYHWDSILGHASGKNPRLMDRFRIHLAKAYESKEYLIDTLETLSAVEDSGMLYSTDEDVSFKRGLLVEKINNMKNQGIVKPWRFTDLHEFRKRRDSQGFLEINRPGESPA